MTRTVHTNGYVHGPLFFKTQPSTIRHDVKRVKWEETSPEQEVLERAKYHAN